MAAPLIVFITRFNFSTENFFYCNVAIVLFCSALCIVLLDLIKSNNLYIKVYFAYNLFVFRGYKKIRQHKPPQMPFIHLYTF